MSVSFAELDYRQTPLGDLSLRRGRVASLDGLEVYEVKLGTPSSCRVSFTRSRWPSLISGWPDWTRRNWMWWSAGWARVTPPGPP